MQGLWTSKLHYEDEKEWIGHSGELQFMCEKYIKKKKSEYTHLCSSNFCPRGCGGGGGGGGSRSSDFIQMVHRPSSYSPFFPQIAIFLNQLSSSFPTSNVIRFPRDRKKKLKRLGRGDSCRPSAKR